MRPDASHRAGQQQCRIGRGFRGDRKVRRRGACRRQRSYFLDRRKRIVALTIANKIPTIFFERDSVVDGALMTYSANFADSFRQVGAYVGRILKGAELPVLQPTKFDLIINLKTAKAIGVTIPPSLLALADEVIE